MRTISVLVVSLVISAATQLALADSKKKFGHETHMDDPCFTENPPDYCKDAWN